MSLILKILLINVTLRLVGQAILPDRIIRPWWFFADGSQGGHLAQVWGISQMVAILIRAPTRQFANVHRRRLVLLCIRFLIRIGMSDLNALGKMLHTLELGRIFRMPLQSTNKESGTIFWMDILEQSVGIIMIDEFCR